MRITVLLIGFILLGLWSIYEGIHTIISNPWRGLWGAGAIVLFFAAYKIFIGKKGIDIGKGSIIAVVKKNIYMKIGISIILLSGAVCSFAFFSLPEFGSSFGEGFHYAFAALLTFVVYLLYL